MSRYQVGDIQCSCGNLVNMELYESVNVTVDPKLLPKVKSRKINSFYCNKCGEKSELAFQFLYVDMNKNYWIWVYPEVAREKKKEIEKDLNKQTGKMQKFLGKLGAGKTRIVFGYDELFEIIDPSLVRNKNDGEKSISDNADVEYFFAKNIHPFLSKKELVELYKVASNEYRTGDLPAVERNFMNDYIKVKNSENISSKKILDQILTIANRRLVQIQKDKGYKGDEIEENMLFRPPDEDNVKNSKLNERDIVRIINLSAISSFSAILDKCPELRKIMETGNTTVEDWDLLMTAAGVGYALKTNSNLDKDKIIKECKEINGKIPQALAFYLDTVRDIKSTEKDKLGASTGVWIVGNLLKKEPDYDNHIKCISLIGNYIDKLLS